MDPTRAHNYFASEENIVSEFAKGIGSQVEMIVSLHQVEGKTWRTRA